LFAKQGKAAAVSITESTTVEIHFIAIKIYFTGKAVERMENPTIIFAFQKFL